MAKPTKSKEPKSTEIAIVTPHQEDIVETITKNTLTERQKEFLNLWFSNGNNATKAVITMGLSKNAALDYGKLLKEPRAKFYLEQLKDQASHQSKLTTGEVIAKARRVYDEAISNGNYKEALAAADLLGKYLGMNVDRSSVEIRNTTFSSGDTPKDVKNDLSAFQDIINKAISKSTNVVKLPKG